MAAADFNLADSTLPLPTHAVPRVPDSGPLERVRQAALDRSYISMGNRRMTSVHEFYRYPARFSPTFTRAVIEAFSDPGQLVVDPFVGGGTSLVEARLLGRPAIGSDLNALAAFVTKAKTTIHRDEDIEAVRRWGQALPGRLNLSRFTTVHSSWKTQGYLGGLTHQGTWRIRKLIALALSELWRLEIGPQQLLARCAILRTSQWALDMRSELPTVDAFRSALDVSVQEMAGVAAQFSRLAREADDAAPTGLERTLTLQRGLPGLASHPKIVNYPPPRLIITSPPYPGVYVLYHRWKLQGRKEIPAPYWIAGCMDGNGQTHYTMAARSQLTLDTYFRRLAAAFGDIVKMLDPDTWVVQLVGFSEDQEQLSRYLRPDFDTSKAKVLVAGTRLCRLSLHSPDLRVWASAGGG